MHMAATLRTQASDDVLRPLAHFPADIWGDRFNNFTTEDESMMDKYAQDIEPLKEEVWNMLMDTSVDSEEKMRLIDVVERLGVSYYYEDEIKRLLDQCFEEFLGNASKSDYNLCSTATQFRIFRQHGYKMPCDVFIKFIDGEGKYKKALQNDLNGMVSLYEATHLRMHGEVILDDAHVYTTDFLKSIETYYEQARHALKRVLHHGIPRVESWHFIFSYEKDDSRNMALLRLAKYDYNRLQLLYRRELSQIQQWWMTLDFATKLPYARQRSVECHFWSIAMYYEPQYSLARMLLVKGLLALSILDDTYDAYGTFEELEHLTNAFERWDSSAIEQLPEDYLKIVFEFVLNTYSEFATMMTVRGKSYVAQFAKDRMMDLIRSYYIEAKWLKEKYVPTFEEYMVNASITGAVQFITTTSLMGIKEIAEAKPFEQIIKAPKAIKACEVISRLMDDIVSHEEEQARGHVASGVECYMKDNNMGREEVVMIFNKMFEDAWKDLNEEILIKVKSSDSEHLPRPLLKRVLNLSRVVDSLYKVIDGYTHSAKLIKDDIIATYVEPMLV